MNTEAMKVTESIVVEEVFVNGMLVDERASMGIPADWDFSTLSFGKEVMHGPHHVCRLFGNYYLTNTKRDRLLIGIFRVGG